MYAGSCMSGRPAYSHVGELAASVTVRGVVEMVTVVVPVERFVPQCGSALQLICCMIWRHAILFNLTLQLS